MNRFTGMACLLLIACLQLPAQVIQQLSVRTTEAVDHWIVYPDREKEKQFRYGFVYIDEQAGFTLHAGGNFEVDGEGHAKLLVDEFFDKKASVKIRLEQNGRMTLLSKELQKQLGLPDRPEWMKFYDDGTNRVQRRVRLGYWYNHLGDSAAALPHLESAYKEQPSAQGLEFELSFAYNALRLFDKAIPVLAGAVQRDPKNVFLGSELAYTYLNMGRFKEAIEQYHRFIPLCSDKELDRKSEMAINLSQAYQRVGDAAGQEKWLGNAKAWAPEGSAVWNFFHPQSQ